jgi:hypothetical protein
VAFDSEIRPTSSRDKLYLDPVSSHLPSVPAVPPMSAYVLTQRLYTPTPTTPDCATEQHSQSHSE